MPELHLKVFADRSELVRDDGETTVFVEGASASSAKIRYASIARHMANGFLSDQVDLCRSNPAGLEIGRLSDKHTSLLDALVQSVTSEIGRALVGLTVLQLCVKSIEPTQSIRLHKGGNSSKDFSWREGISMRVLDRNYVAPVLRETGLLSLNKDGFMMTRTLAENYPYSKVYKAGIRGAKVEWSSIVEEVESNRLEPRPALQYLLSQLLNHANRFKELAVSTLKELEEDIQRGSFRSQEDVSHLLRAHINSSNYAARIMEIGMHSLAQTLSEFGAVNTMTLKPLSQMRSANKKHGNIGDIEFLEGSEIIESWDAKYGKSYLRDELEELSEKLANHASLEVAGFVTSAEPERLDELIERWREIEEIHGIKIQIVTLERWIAEQFLRASHGSNIHEHDLAQSWVRAYAESLAQMRPVIAPIDEPCFQWMSTLRQVLNARRR